MSKLTPERRIVLYDADGNAYQPVRSFVRSSGRSVFKVKPRGASNKTDEAIQTDSVLEVARYMFVEGLPARCQSLLKGPVNYLRFGADKLVGYELGAEIASELGIQERSGDIKVDNTKPSRLDVENAMDTYDTFQVSQMHAEIFDKFGTPRDYWVRSTRNRPDRRYPSKQIVGYLKNSPNELYGGWTSKSAAAAVLYDAGFIIISSDDEPILPPENSKTEINDADRIRLVAANYYIEPARERGETQVSIAVSDLAKILSLENTFPNICNALGGRKFQELVGVPPPSNTLPNPSSTTVFTYRLSERSPLMSEETKPASADYQPINLIFYGPPGTGKTYRTALEALRLCIGEDAASLLEDDRASVMSRYKELVDAGQIEFVTFHQSFSYEDFVEGLRPTTEHSSNDDDPSERSGESAGFSLRVNDGVFKAISERARLDVSGKGEKRRLDRKSSVLKVSLGRAAYGEEDKIKFGLNSGLIHSDWGGDVDWSEEQYDAFGSILARLREIYGDKVSGYDWRAIITHTLRSKMQVGDYVLLSDGRDRVRALGCVTGDYYHDDGDQYPAHRRSVEWLWEDDGGIDRERIYSKAFARHSVYPLDDQSLDWDRLDELVFGSDIKATSSDTMNYVLIIDEINRANISKVFGELITLLEPDKRIGAENEIRLRLPYSGKPFGVPRNLHIIGTMNTPDRSIALLDTALRRRFSFMELMPSPELLSTNVEGVDLRSLLRTLNERIEYLFDREHQIGRAYFYGCQSQADIAEVLRFKIIPLLSEYFYEDWSKVDAVLGAGKFLKKHELKSPPGMEIDDLSESKYSWRVLDQFDLSEFEA